MGCDIHICVEKKVNDKWVMVNRLHHGSPATVRNYRRFAALAGVRGNGPEPKGLPEDISDSTRLCSDEWGVDGHSHSYMDLQETAKIYLRTEYSDENNEYINKYPESHYFDIEESELKDYRIVFWFDN